ncbi:hypothetical protein CVU76_03140 [Candidatus Dojkabacteria bacterium HGW-Dojkabacteria-1]|uniref:Uncharacterized protein n=1 Tax=Candidatus Dojkabacteria bacterium HGW-Dojkabacteria-1 TaxID=2013761 RepID=A0A2N2F452_9BACT|nr:MAG: hypothetical protein CVU76_03140 [Candidatus Dojkabacteria bacterium HGW-Dojkabacteria-1]
MEKNSVGTIIWTILGILLLISCCFLSLFVLGLNGFSMRIGSSELVINEQKMENPAVVIHTQQVEPTRPTIVQNPTPVPLRICDYDYNIMPIGVDEFDNRLADKGIKVTGTIAGPAIVKINKDHIVIIYPGNSWKGSGTLWQYVGDSKCLEAQIQYFEKESKTYIK